MESQIIDQLDEIVDEMIKEDTAETAELTDKLIEIWKSSLDERKIQKQ